MLRRDYRDIIGGGLLTLTGLGVAIYANANYALGTVTHMGPGMVPAALGVLLAFFGLIVSVTAYAREGSWPEFRVVTPLIVLASIGVFGLLVANFGMMPAIFLSTIVASMAELKFRPLVSVALGLFMCALAYIIFTVGLGLTYSLFAWPF